MAGRSKRNVLRDYVGLPTLVLYVGLLVFSSMVGPARPAWLDSPHRLAKSALHVGGVIPGITLFRAEKENPYVFRSWCIKARGHASTGERVDLYPIPMGCQKTGIRLRVSPVKLGFDHMLKEAHRLELEIRSNPQVAQQTLRRDALLSRLGEYFCSGAGVAQADLERVSVLWYAYLVHYQHGKEARGSYLAFDYQCREGVIANQLWLPDDATTARFWGEEPWE